MAVNGLIYVTIMIQIQMEMHARLETITRKVNYEISCICKEESQG